MNTVSSDGSMIVSGSKDNTLGVWDALSGSELSLLKGHKSSVTLASFSPDRRKIVLGSNDTAIGYGYIIRK